MSHDTVRLQDLPIDIFGRIIQHVELDESLAAKYVSKQGLLRCVCQYMRQAVDATVEHISIQQDLDSEELAGILQRFRGLCTATNDQWRGVSAHGTLQDIAGVASNLSPFRCMQLI